MRETILIGGDKETLSALCEFLQQKEVKIITKESDVLKADKIADISIKIKSVIEHFENIETENNAMVDFHHDFFGKEFT